MNINIRHDGTFKYIEEGEGHTIVLLHGLFGALSNWADVLEHFTSQNYRVSIPLMPVYSGEPVCKSVGELAQFVLRFMDARGYGQVSLVGNSLGGHVGLLLTLAAQHRVKTLTLTGSSGLFEEGMGSGFVKRGDQTFIRERVAFTFYDPKTATQELVDEVFGIVNDRVAAMRVLNLARDAQRTNLRDDLRRITVPTCLIWGLNDNITPTHVAHEFHHLMPHAELHFVDHCGHAPMMEQNARFNRILSRFLQRHLEPVLEPAAVC